MDSASTENFLYIALAAVAVIFFFVMFIQGWMMKLAVRICGGNEIGIFYGMSALTLSSLAGAAASITTAVVLPDVNPLLAALASVAGSVLLLCLMLQMGPIRAFAVYLTQGLLSLVSVAALVAVGVAGVYFFVPPQSLEQFAENAKTRMMDVNPAAFSGGSAGDGGEAEVQGLNDLAQLLGGFQMPVSQDDAGEETSEGKQQFDAKALQNALGQALFSNKTSEDLKSEPEAVQQSSNTQQAQPKKPPIQSPYDNRIKSNPFVK